MPLLKIEQLSKRYGTDKYALDTIDFTVDTGEFVAIIGPSGAGKSTLLRCINHMIPLTWGSCD